MPTWGMDLSLLLRRKKDTFAGTQAQLLEGLSTAIFALSSTFRASVH